MSVLTAFKAALLVAVFLAGGALGHLWTQRAWDAAEAKRKAAEAVATAQAFKEASDIAVRDFRRMEAITHETQDLQARARRVGGPVIVLSGDAVRLWNDAASAANRAGSPPVSDGTDRVPAPAQAVEESYDPADVAQWNVDAGAAFARVKAQRDTCVAQYRVVQRMCSVEAK